jgi:uncharacterized repeat protein (TIGR03803 family)
MRFNDAMNMSRSICLGRRLRALLVLIMLTAAAVTLQAGVAITNLYSFTGGNDGGNPEWALTQGSDGNLYGTTSIGGTNGFGTVFEISSTGMFSNLYSFTGGDDGGSPSSGLTQGAGGSLYGTTFGAIFKITSDGALTALAEITDGSRPTGGVVHDGDGNVYGTTVYGGNNKGTVYEVSPDGTMTNLYVFNGMTDGGYPYDALTLGRDGNFYGTTRGGLHSNPGTVFKISPTGALTTLHYFSGGSDGGNPYSALVQGSDGDFYGTTSAGGITTNGTIFKISPGGVFTNLYLFTGGTDGADPRAGLTLGVDGNFYGVSSAGGTNGYGTLFEVSPEGKFSSLYSFTGGDDGANPQAGLVLGSDGNLYGMTTQGGAGGNGVVFRLTVGSLSSILIPIDSAFGFNNGIFGFDVSGPAGSRLVIQVSSDLRSWTSMQTNQIGSGSVYFSDPQSSTNHQRFYRVVLP